MSIINEYGFILTYEKFRYLTYPWSILSLMIPPLFVQVITVRTVFTTVTIRSSNAAVMSVTITLHVSRIIKNS